MNTEQHVHKLKSEKKSLQPATNWRICILCHQQGHNKNACKFTTCESHIFCGMKDKHLKLTRNIFEAQKIVTGLKKNWIRIRTVLVSAHKGNGKFICNHAAISNRLTHKVTKFSRSWQRSSDASKNFRKDHSASKKMTGN